MKKYELTEDDIHALVQNTLNSVFRALAFKDVRLDVGSAQLPVTAEVHLDVVDDVIRFHVQLLPKVDVRVSYLAETPEEIKDAARRIGFRNNNGRAGK